MTNRREVELPIPVVGGEEAGGGPAFLVGGRRKGRPNQLDAGQTQFAEQQVNARGVDLVGRFHAASPRAAAISS